MDVDLQPPTQVGPVRIGMPFEDAKTSLSALEGFDAERSFTRTAPGFAVYSSGLSFTLSYTDDEGVRTVEVYGAGTGRGVVYAGVDIFTTPAAELTDQFSAEHDVRVEQDGRLVILPGKSVSFWRATLPEGDWDEDGRYFQTVLVAHQGYFV
jgi:hypothetical protein